MRFVLYTVGHSNQPAEALVMTLLEAGVRRLVDVRRFPASRRNPQFNREALASLLAVRGIEYGHAPELGGRREPLPDSTNSALRDPGFRGFADYMATAEFEGALQVLIDEAGRLPTAIMCAESLPWRCHRSLIADALVARGIEVRHLVGGRQRPHELSVYARVEEGRVTYPGLV